MSKLGLFLFVFALFVCCISAYAADPGVKLQADETVRVAREASAQPDPGHRWHNRGYQYHYQPQHYPSWNKYHGNGGWGGSRRKH
ncbi:hypothetical protein KQX54_005621 [Cotesia glomerata]|uniref:Uncharacterized protein n=1 Tax=Cotesia glomerata TaxID=32391 RepID=A0AAV7IG08_COTGL|nr:hypothetical protein KQX54_005621 [Cotesia glomerata]